MLLKEGISDIVYHFTSLFAGYRICVENEIKLQSTFAKDAEVVKGGKEFYLSTTRVRDVNVGYGSKFKMGGVRFCLDGRKLSNRFSGRPLNYWNGLTDKFEYMRKSYPDYDSMLSGNKYEIERFKREHPDASDDDIKNFLVHNFNRGAQNHISNESEDRIFSTDPMIGRFSDYIISVDVLLPQKGSAYSTNDEIISLFKQTVLVNRIRFFDNVDEFNKKNGKTVTNDSYVFHHETGFGRRDDSRIMRRLRDTLSYVIKFIAYGNPEFEDGKFYKSVASLLRKYELSKFLNDVGYFHDELKRCYSFNSIADSAQGYIRELSDEPNDYSTKILKLATDYFRSLGASSYREACQIKKKNVEDYYSEKRGGYASERIDTRKVMSFYVNDYSRVVSVNPEKDLFMDFMGWDTDDAKYKADGLSYEIFHDENYKGKSKNYTSLFHYFNKLFTKGSVKYVFDTLEKSGLMGYLNENGFRLSVKEMNYYDAVDYKTVNSLKLENSGDFDNEYKLRRKEIEKYFK